MALSNGVSTAAPQVRDFFSKSPFHFFVIQFTTPGSGGSGSESTTAAGGGSGGGSTTAGSGGGGGEGGSTTAGSGGGGGEGGSTSAGGGNGGGSSSASEGCLFVLIFYPSWECQIHLSLEWVGLKLQQQERGVTT